MSTIDISAMVVVMENAGSGEETLPDGFAEEFDLTSLGEHWPEAAMQTTDPRIRIASTPEELHAISRLRYDLYIARDGKRYDRARHIARMFVEPIDQVSLNFFTTVDARTVGSVRLVRAEDALTDRHLKLIIEAAQPNDIKSAVVNSRFVVLPEMRARSLIAPMFQQVYRSGLLAGARECYIATRSELIPIFERFGYRSTSSVYEDAVAGASIVLKLDLYGIEHMRAVRSPLLSIAEKYISDLTPGKNAA